MKGSVGSYHHNDTGGCYVATCVYGSYDCPEVWTLRRFRDDTLAKTWAGRAFVRTYYAISPDLVRRFGTFDWFRNMWKAALDYMVQSLRDRGVENTPYISHFFLTALGVPVSFLKSSRNVLRAVTDNLNVLMSESPRI